MAVCALGVLPSALTAQGIDEAVARVDDGTIRLAFATRPGVEICDQGIRMGDHHMWWSTNGYEDGASNCRVGSVEVELDVRDGQVRDIEVVRGIRHRTASASDIGEVEARQAADYFLGLARDAVRREAARDAVFPVVLADVEEAWRDLMSLARDRDVRSGVRKNALFWVGQEAAEAATDGLAEVARDDDEDQEVRNAAVFALSQRSNEEGLPILMELARNARDGETRRTAMFWLAQSGDDRVLAFFEEILVGRGGA
jgi:HEAT repeat protein